MLEEERAKLLDYERRNAAAFQVIGSLKLLNIKVKSFVSKLECVNEQDTKKMAELNAMFRNLRRDVRFFQEEFKCFETLDMHVSSVDTFSKNIKRLFMKETVEYTFLEMRRISVYLYRIADIMLQELNVWKLENDQRIHEIQKRNGKYYFNRK